MKFKDIPFYLKKKKRKKEKKKPRVVQSYSNRSTVTMVLKIIIDFIIFMIIHKILLIANQGKGIKADYMQAFAVNIECSNLSMPKPLGPCQNFMIGIELLNLICKISY